MDNLSRSEFRLLVLADLHMDQWESRLMAPHAMSEAVSRRPKEFEAPDLVVSAGDLAHAGTFGWKHGISEVRRSLPGDTPLLLIPGNHDYYLAELDDAPLRAECEMRKASFGQKAETFLGATRILSCTLWSDGLLFGEEHRAEVLRIVQAGLNDYRMIRKPGSPMPITAMDTLSLHEDHLAWLAGRLATRHDGPTVIITHHGPHPEASLPLDAISAGFVSDLSEMIEEHQPDAWVFGHTHRPQSAILGKTRIHNVGLGYPDEAAAYGVSEIMMRGCLMVGDEVRFLMDEVDPRPVRTITPRHALTLCGPGMCLDVKAGHFEEMSAADAERFRDVVASTDFGYD